MARGGHAAMHAVSRRIHPLATHRVVWVWPVFAPHCCPVSMPQSLGLEAWRLSPESIMRG